MPCPTWLPLSSIRVSTKTLESTVARVLLEHLHHQLSATGKLWAQSVYIFDILKYMFYTSKVNTNNLFQKWDSWLLMRWIPNSRASINWDENSLPVFKVTSLICRTWCIWYDTSEILSRSIRRDIVQTKLIVLIQLDRLLRTIKLL